jgi:5,10-methylenetetrahydromethanopterin reductase
MMRVDIRVPVGLPLPRLADFIARCEDAGFDGVGVHDHPHTGRDTYVALALAAARTRRLALYPVTSSPVVRHPLVLASLARSLAEIAPGRIRLSIAPGFLAVRAIGQARGTVDRMREALRVIRRLLAGEAVDFGGTQTRLRNTDARPTPVYLLAAGPRMVELAGELADGALLLVGLHAAAVAAARDHLAAGAHRAGREPSAIPTIFIVPTAVEDDTATAHQWPRRYCMPGLPWLSYPSRSNPYWLRRAGLDVPDDPVPERIGDELAARICDAFGLFGPPGHCRDRLLRAREEAGVEHVFLYPSHTAEESYVMPEREVTAFARDVLPHLPR